MAKRRKPSKCLEPINSFLDIAGAATLGLYVKHKVKKDFENDCGEESAKAAVAVFGMGSMRRGSQGRINLGGLIGLNSALKDIKRQESSSNTFSTENYVSPTERMSAIRRHAKVGLWREHCEDGSVYGISPMDYGTADDYEEALNAAKSHGEADDRESGLAPPSEENLQPDNIKYYWRKHCEDGSPYGLSPEDYATADDYEDALAEAKKRS